MLQQETELVDRASVCHLNTEKRFVLGVVHILRNQLGGGGGGGGFPNDYATVILTQ